MGEAKRRAAYLSSDAYKAKIELHQRRSLAAKKAAETRRQKKLLVEAGDIVLGERVVK